MLSYFGTDQSQVQRYLTAKSVHDARHSLLMSAYWKIPLQVLVLLIGVFMFVFYLFTAPPMLFNRAHGPATCARAREPQNTGRSSSASRWRSTSAATPPISWRPPSASRIRRRLRLRARASTPGRRKSHASAAGDGAGARGVGRSDLQRRELRVPDVHPDATADRADRAAHGGDLLAAAIPIAAELNSLSTATVIDFYRRYVTTEASRCATTSKCRGLRPAFWGVFASLVAIWAAELGSLIEVVNRFGSFFYGSILGVFLLAFLWRRANGTGAFVGVDRRAWPSWPGSPRPRASRSSGTTSSAAVTVFVVGVIVSAIVPSSRRP